MDVGTTQRVTSWPPVPLHDLGCERDRLEDYQVRSRAAFAWRALEEMRAAWGRALGGGRVEMVLLDAQHRRAFLLARQVVETVPFPWHPKKTAWYFYWPGRLEPVVMWEPDALDALAADGVSVKPTWVKGMVQAAMLSTSALIPGAGPGPGVS